MGFMAIRESEIERHLAVSVKKLGGMAVKFVSPGLDGVPDCLITGEEDCFCGVEGPWEEDKAFAGEEEEAVGGSGFSGLCDRRPGADWRCAG